MGQQGSLTIPELQQPKDVKAAATKFHDRPNSPFSEATGRWWEIISSSLTSYFSISFPLCLTGYQVAAWTEWNCLSPLGPPFPQIMEYWDVLDTLVLVQVHALEPGE